MKTKELKAFANWAFIRSAMFVFGGERYDSEIEEEIKTELEPILKRLKEANFLDYDLDNLLEESWVQKLDQEMWENELRDFYRPGFHHPFFEQCSWKLTREYKTKHDLLVSYLNN